MLVSILSQRPEVIGGIRKDYTDDQIKNEPMLWAASPAFVREKGGGLTNRFLDVVQSYWPTAPCIKIDTRSHMLMPGWIPAIPGWHHDDVQRTGWRDSQPNYVTPTYRTEHLVLCLNADIAPTEFAFHPYDPVEFELPPAGNVYAAWTQRVDELVAEGTYITENIADGLVYAFSDRDFHRANPANARGWRYFARATVYIDDETGEYINRPGRPLENEIRNQVQVYMPEPEAGW